MGGRGRLIIKVASSVESGVDGILIGIEVCKRRGMKLPRMEFETRLHYFWRAACTKLCTVHRIEMISKVGNQTIGTKRNGMKFTKI